MQWASLSNEVQLKKIIEKSATASQVIYKHSTRCSLSDVVKRRLEREKTPAGIDFYYLDVLAYRSLSKKIAQDLDVSHESPQILLIKNGHCVYAESHMGISMKEIEAQNMLNRPR